MAATSGVANSGNVDIDGLLSGVRWTSGALTYSFTTSSSQYDYSVPGFQAFNDAQKTATENALANYAAVANLTFSKVSGGAGTLRFAESNDPATAYAYYPHPSAIGGDAFFNHTDYNTADKGTYSYLTFLHEIGHTLGLDHGQDGSGALPTDHDSLEYSVMTYRSYVGADLNGYTVAEGSYPTTLMMADIAALQYMYGANFGTNAGNSTYKWNASTGEMLLNGVSKGASTTNTVFMTIWDGGGTDTYDFSAYSSNLKINLQPGEWSLTSSAQLANLGGGEKARGNIANAWLYEDNTASLIENATGGSGADMIIGNQAKNVLKGGNGNDSLKGLTGNDTIYGGAGTDTCYIATSSTTCTVTYDATAKKYLIVSAGGGTDTVYDDVELFAFSDKTVNAGVISPDSPILLSASPADNTSSVKDTANIVLTFSETVVAGKGKIVIRQADGTVFQSFDMAKSPAGVTISDKTVTIDPSGYFKAGTGYYVTIDAGALKDADGKSFSGIASKADLNFVTEKGVIRGTSQAETMSGSTKSDRLYGAGGNDSLIGRDGNDKLDGGSGADNMAGGRGDDTYTVSSSGDKVVEAEAQGTDTVLSSISYALTSNVEKLTLTGTANINGTGNGLANTLTGNSGNNTLAGRAGNDTIMGGAGNDKLYGELGNDVLTGGTGNDRFVFDDAVSSSNVDTITDFSVADDTIVFDGAIFAALSAGALSDDDFAFSTDLDVASAHIVYNSSTGALFYDKDGTGSAADMKFVQLTTGLLLTAADFLVV
jgi:serralysin